MNPTWYDLLDVDPTASTDEIRSAWKSAIADLDPTDRRFGTLNEAAAVLLDADRRAAYDAGLAADETAEPVEDDVTDDEPAGDAPDQGEPADDEPAEDDTADDETTDDEPRPARTLPLVPWWALACLAVVTLALVVSAVVSLVGGGTQVITAANNNQTQSTYEQNYGDSVSINHTTRIEEPAHAAMEAAKAAIVPLLSYDYRHLDQDKEKASAYLTDDYQEDYDRVFALIEQNAPRTKTVVETLRPLDAGIVRATDRRVEVLLFVDRPTTNKASSEPVPYRDYVTLTMQLVDDTWLVDQMATQPAGSGSSGSDTPDN